MKRQKLGPIFIGWLIAIITNLSFAINFNPWFWIIVVILAVTMIYDLIYHFKRSDD